jgi:hypothetical protein
MNRTFLDDSCEQDLQQIQTLLNTCESRVSELHSCCNEIRVLIASIKSEHQFKAQSRLASTRANNDIDTASIKSEAISKLEEELLASRKDIKLLFSQLNQLIEQAAMQDLAFPQSNRMTVSKIKDKAKKVLKTLFDK